ncbi:MAG: PEP-CTERM sorting domain-containing protein [Acidobacteria bacterium]|nr:PEP-CTERM sorting domain-containing protein [Acidobacteriota bacterium]
MKIIAVGLLALASLSAFGATLNYSATTVGGPTWNRPVEGTPPNSISGVGTVVAYDVLPFWVDLSGSYTFQNTGVTPANWDNYTFLYVTSFNPAAQLTNVIIGDDDNLVIGLSGFTTNLTASTQYYFVTTGFGNTDAGAFNLEISGQGNITAGQVNGQVPEPSTWALAGLGLAALSVISRRRK